MMSDKQIEGGAGPALAAHSKDASAPSKNPASAATPDPIRKSAGKARSVANKASRAVVGSANKAVQEMGQSDGSLAQLEAFARDNPLAAMLATGILGLIVGTLLTRR